ncbi:FMR1-interacting protein NUFIP2 [Elgaria multicarinata webbii]|uniref:FMR1-interacting protein NUFIP2 n=1 Tax=Elgaria multicarinata webbii TaxID=159646 RepID=UPI002FCD16F5
MEEQPGQQQQQPPPPPPPPPPHHHHHHHHHHHYYYYNHNHHQHHQQYLAEGSGPAKAQPQKAPLQALKHEPKHGGLPPPEAPRKRAGYGELNGSVGERECSGKSLNAGDASAPISRVPNGSQPPGDPNLTLKQTVKGSAFGKPGLKAKSFVPKGGMDKKNEKCYESKTREGPSSDKPEGLPIPNGVVANSSGYITNGYVSKGADNDGSGSESGYTTPKKRKGRRNSAKGCENLSLAPEQVMQHEPPLAAPALKQEPEGFKPDCGEPKAGSRIDGLKPAWKCEAGGLGVGRGKPGVGDAQRKNSDTKVGPASKKFEERPKGKHGPLAAASKEDSWTLFKPPPVFPVDNSSAKIVPKISYASKVKENLNKAAQNPAPSLSSSSSSSSSSSLCSSSAVEVQVQTSSRLSQVPMSAMKSVTSANFSNGPVLAGADRGACPAGTPSLLMPMASAVLSAASELVPQDGGPTSLVAEPQKPGLFIYPSNMQALLNAAAQAEAPIPTSQQSLGDIFQNQWGLSFINEPSAGPETAGRKPSDTKATEVTFQGDCPAALGSQGAETAPSGPDHPVFPKAYELDKRTSPQLLGGLLKLGISGEGGGFLLESHQPGGPRQAEPGGLGAFVFLAKDYHVESRLASPTNSLLTSAKEQRYQRGLERRASRGDFDLRAAVLYHAQEMENIRNLQKQDPKRIITYDEAMDHPNQ